LPFITEDFKIPVKRIWLEEILDSTETSVIESTPATIEKIEYKIS
jgi:hypothetical protein